MFRTLSLMFVSVAVCAGSAQAQWGTLSGQFVFDGDPPAAKKLTITKDQQFCGKFNLTNEEVVVNPDNNGLANVALYLYVGRGKKAPKAHPSYEATANEKVTLDNLNCRFEPRVVALRTTQTLLVGNKDSVGHNTKVDAIKNIPKNPIIPANGSTEMKFPKEERLPTLVSCSIHPWMSARVIIKASPYMAVTDKDGKFKIENLPVGEHTFQVWHEACGYVAEVTIDGKKEKWARGRVELTVNDGDNDLGQIKVSPSLLK